MFRQIQNLFQQFNDRDSFQSGAGPSGVVGLITFPFRLLIAWVAFMVTVWALSRSASAFTRGLPALAACGGFIVALTCASFLLETSRINTYQQRYYRQLYQEEDPVMATGFAEKLVRLSPEDVNNRYLLGIAKYESNDHLGAVNVMKYIADEKNDPRAQVWLGETILRTNIMELSDEESVEEAAKFYRAAVNNLDPDNRDEVGDYTKATLGLSDAFLYRYTVAKTEAAREIALKNAIKQLDTVVNGKIMLVGQLLAIPKLIDLHLKNREPEEARDQLRLSVQNVGPLARRNPDKIEIWSILVQSCVLVDEFDYAEEIIQEGLQLASNDQTKQQIRQLLGQVLLLKADFVKDVSSERNYRLRLEIISQAISANPSLVAGYKKLFEFVAPEKEEPEHEKWLRRSVIGSRTPGVTHVVMGLRALNRGDSLEGQRHWQIASRQSPYAQHMINMLIGYSHKNAPEEFSNLGDIASVAIESFPSHFPLYYTRGTIYLEDGQFDEALKDLETAVQRFPDEMNIHETLVTAYEKNKQPSKAEQHREIVKRLKLEIEQKKTELLEQEEEKKGI